MNAPTTPSPPRMPAGHEFVRELARGGLGVVYLARNRTLNALRAIKRPYSRRDLEPESALDERALLARFRRERLAIGSLDHPHENIIRAYDAGEDDEGPYLIMEYLNGESLAGLLKRGGRLNVPEACELVRQAAIGLGVAHKLGLVHRDVKPSNLMLARTHDGARVVVIDWGLVKRLESNGAPDRLDDLFADRSLTSAGAAMGTPDYMSPDQILDATDVDARADIYSLGVTFYALFAGQAPFQDRKRRQEKFRGQIHDPFPRLVGIRSEVCAIIDKMVEKSPERRFATAEDVAKLLEPLCCEPRSPSLLALLDPPGSTATYPPPDNSPFEQETKLGALPLPDPDGPASSKAPPVDEASNVGPPSAPILKLAAVGAVLPAVGRKPRETRGESTPADTSNPICTPFTCLGIWVIAGLVSGLLGWVSDPGSDLDDLIRYGAILGVVLGLAGGIARRSARAAFRAAIVGGGLAAIEVGGLAAIEVDAAVNWRIFIVLNRPIYIILILLVVGAVPGLMLRLGLGGQGRWVRSALGGLLGVCAALVVIRFTQLCVFHVIKDINTIGEVSCKILIAVFVAVGAGLFAVGSRNPGSSG